MDPRERRPLPYPSGPPSQKALTTALRRTPTPRPSDEDSQEPEGVRSKAGQGWARLISQNHYTRVHTLRGAVLCSHPNILQCIDSIVGAYPYLISAGIDNEAV